MRRPLVLACALLLISPLAARAVFINEVMSNPGTIDWNGDAVINVVQDEYVELVNPDAFQVDLSGWTISDAIAVRHVFEVGTFLPAGGSIVVFGGGNVFGFSGFATTASTGALELGNPGDSVFLEHFEVVQDSVTFGAATAGQSFNRNPDLNAAAPFTLHAAVTGAIGNGSPGRRVDNSLFPVEPLVLPFINEWLPNPDTAVNDWNLDGVGDDAHDEFVEIVNPANGEPIDISFWTLADAAQTRHIFAAGTVLAPGASIVVIANGTPSPAIPGLAVAASTHSLGLSNAGGDTIQLHFDDFVVSSVSYVDQTPDVSWNRSPDAEPSTPNFALHSAIAPGDSLSSPGRRIDGTPFPTPEPGGAALVAFGALGWLARASRLRSFESHR